VAYYLPRSLLRSWPFAGVNSRIARRWGWVAEMSGRVAGWTHTLEKSVLGPIGLGPPFLANAGAFEVECEQVLKNLFI
jgi:hypothetical protein